MRYHILIALGMLAALPHASKAQVRVGAEDAQLTIEGFINATAGAVDESQPETADDANWSNVATALRALGE